MKKLPPLLGLGLFIFLGGAGQAQDKWDLKKCIDYAVSNNISVKQQDVQARIAKLLVEQYQLSQIPNLMFQGNGSFNSGYTQNPQTFTLSTSILWYNTYGLTSQINFFNFNNIRDNIAGSRFAYEAANAGTDKLKNDVSLNVANAYLNFLMMNETANAASLQLSMSQANLSNTTKLVAAGSLPELNQAELESQVAQDSSTFVTAQSNKQQAILTVKAYMSFDAAATFELDTPSVDKIPIESLGELQPDVVYSLALLNQPLQKVDALNVKSAIKYTAAYRAAMYPVLTAFGQLGSTYINQSYEQNQPYFNQLNTAFKQSLGIGLTIPIFNQGSYRLAYERSKWNVANYQLQQAADNLTLKQNIYLAYSLAVAALQKFESNKKTLDATQRSFDFAQKRYNVGLLNTIDLLTNQNNFFKAKIDLLSAQFDFVFKMKVLEFYKGMGLKL